MTPKLKILYSYKRGIPKNSVREKNLALREEIGVCVCVCGGGRILVHVMMYVRQTAAKSCLEL